MASPEGASSAAPLLRGLAVRLRERAGRWLARARASGCTPTRNPHVSARLRTPVAAQITCHPGGVRPNVFLYLSVGLVAGTLIALQIAIMGIFSVGSSAHLGAVVVSLAMLGFGLTSAIMCIGKGWCERNWQAVARLSLLLFGPLIVIASLVARQIPFNTALAPSDPVETWRLAGNFLVYMLPFLPGAIFLGTVFLKAQSSFGRLYFADLTGSGLGGLLVLGAMSLIAPEHLLLVPLLLWLAGSVLWFVALGHLRAVAWVGAIAAACVGLHLAAPVDGQPIAAPSDQVRIVYSGAFLQPTSATLAADQLELLQGGQSDLLVWATLGIACVAALSLVLLPLAFGWRTIFSRNPGKLRTLVYFACLGAGYIMVEVGLITKFTPALGNAIVSASVLITGMLVFSGFGSLLSERYLDRARTVMPRIFLAIGALLIGYGLALDRVLDWIGTLPHALRLLLCFALIFPPAFLMGFPMPIAMSWLSRLGKGHMFLWAWGINGCFSVVGAAMVPVIASSFGLAAVLTVSGCAYLLAILGFFAVLLPLAAPRAREAM